MFTDLSADSDSGELDLSWPPGRNGYPSRGDLSDVSLGVGELRRR